jgi:CRISPR-associated protein Csd1
MILQALNDYYVRKSADPDAHMAPVGFEWKEIPFIIELDHRGQPIQIINTRDGKGGRGNAKSFLVPQGIKKTGNVEANLLWGNAEYVFGLPDIKKLAEKTAKGKRAEYLARLVSAKTAFVNSIRALPFTVHQDPGIGVILRFLESIDFKNLERFPTWEQITKFNPNISFRLNGEIGLICHSRLVVGAVQAGPRSPHAGSFCLITGKPDEVERLHDPIKGVWGAKTSGANIVSFNLPAFVSYGKSQGENAPVGKEAAQHYVKALNHLLARDSVQRIQVGDASTVFWAEKPNVLESNAQDIFGEPSKDDPDRGVRAVRSLYRAVENGAFTNHEGKIRFYVLGLAPNAARIAIRFWHAGTVAELATNICRHFDDLKIIRAASEKRHLSLFRLLLSTAAQKRRKTYLPILEVMSYAAFLLRHLTHKLCYTLYCVAFAQSNQKKTSKARASYTSPTRERH